MSKNILYVHQYFSLSSGSDSIRSYKNAIELSEKGYNVTVLCGVNGRNDCGLTGKFSNNKRSGYVEGLKIIQYNFSYSNYMGFIKRSLVFLKFSIFSLLESIKGDYDIVYATSTPISVALTGIFSKWILRKKFIFEIRDLWPELPYSMGIIKNKIIYYLLLIFELISYFSADICIGLSPGICDGISSKGIKKSKIKLIPNSCDLEIFFPLKLDIKKNPKLINKFFEEDDFIIAFTGAHGLANGLDAILDVAKVLKDQNFFKIKFLFIGDGKCKPGLINRKEQEELDNCFFMDPISKVELASLLRESVHVGLMILQNNKSFYRGTSPNKFFDYISSGLPVINNYPGWLADLINKYNMGIVVKPNDPIDFSKALIKLYKNPLIVQEMSINSREIAERLFSRKVQTEKLVRTFYELY